MQLEKLEGFVEKKSIRAAMIENYDSMVVLGVSNKEGITQTDHKKSKDLSKYQLIEESDFAYNPYRINVGSIGLVPPKVSGLVSPAYVVFKTKEGLIPELLLYFLKSNDGLFQINKYARGTVRKALRFEDLCQIQMHIPNLQCQNRILQKKWSIESESHMLKTEVTHQQTLLKNLRQQILQEAIEGKLTNDWRATHPDAEPASELLKRIAAEKAELIKTKKIKKQKPLPPVSEEEKPFALPDGWAWCRLGEIIEIKSGKRIHAADYRSEGIPFLRSGEISSLGRGEQLKTGLFIEENQYLEIKEKFGVPKEKDILIACIGGSIGNTWVVDDREFYFKDGNIVWMISISELNFMYLLNYLKTPYFWNNTILNATDSSYSALTIVKLNYAAIPFPPLPEQQAIVTKVEKLLTLCDQLETQITQNQTHAAALMQGMSDITLNFVGDTA